MARTIDQIYSSIEAEKNANADLASLSSASRTAIYKLTMYVVAVSIWALENLQDLFKKEVQDIITNGLIGNERWLAAEARKYQFGDTLQIDDTTGVYGYATVDETKQIVKRVAVQTSGGVTKVKAAKEASGAVVQLTELELSGFRAYMNQIQLAGTNITVSSLPADLMKLPITVYYDALRKLDEVKAETEAAVNTYIANLDFNGTFFLSRLQDAVQAVPSTVDVVLGTVEARPDASTYTAVTRTYRALAGYVKVDPDYPLSSTITYVPA
jgi:hypothetical protein